MNKQLLVKKVSIPKISILKSSKDRGGLKVYFSCEEFCVYKENNFGDYEEIFCLKVANSSFCCGVGEIGQICLYEDFEGEQKEIAEKYIDDYLAYLLNLNTKSVKKTQYKRAIIANLIPLDDKGSKFLKESFIRTEYFTLVKSFKNINSGNLIETWISNN